jgi:hypothetical protein
MPVPPSHLNLMSAKQSPAGYWLLTGPMRSILSPGKTPQEFLESGP